MNKSVIEIEKILVLFFVLLSTVSLKAQKEDVPQISGNDYEFINIFFGNENNGKVPLYHRTYSDKAWANYFTQNGLSEIKNKVGLPTLISDMELDTLLTEYILSKINNEILSSIPIELDKSKLSKNIRLEKTFDDFPPLSKVVRISKPIIVEDVAVFRVIGFYEAPIYICKRENDEWKTVYTFYDWSILH